ncbi:MAG TPA: hypothetical protein VFW23_18945 [Tepidisphaeraceae bacterium]|nr:hypothetical protein [Tepidisphaeraceae bacterium]
MDKTRSPEIIDEMQGPQSAVMAIREFVVRPLAFRCRPAGRKNAPERFTAQVYHYLNSPSGPEMAELKKTTGKCSAQIEAFYERHNGFVLYRDSLSSAAGMEALPIRTWAKATERLHESVQDRAEDEEESSELILCVVFATVPRSGNYFAIQTSGQNSGAVYYTDHEALLALRKPFAPDFDGFISRLISEPIDLLTKVLGCFTRYSDGTTTTQWIPAEVQPGSAQ